MSDVRSFSVLSPQDGESREESGRETPHYGVQPTDRSTEGRGIADCDNVAENKLGHDGTADQQAEDGKEARIRAGPASDCASQMAMREEFAESR